MSIEIESRIRTDIDDIDDRQSGLCITGTILHCDYDLELDDDVKETIGKIHAWEIFAPIDNSSLWANSICQDLYDAIIWLQELSQHQNDVAVLSNYTFIEKVEIKPEWRGCGIALKAVAAFLEAFSRDRFVFLKPAPLQMLEVPEEQRKQIKRLRMFWEKLGLDRYDSEANYLWSLLWECPKRLSGTKDIFS